MSEKEKHRTSDGRTSETPTDERWWRWNADWGSLARGGLLLLVVIGMLWLAFNVRLPSLETLQRQIDALGWAGFLGFILLYAVVGLTPIPVTIMAVAGGLIYGVVEGTVLSVAGAVLGCWGAYWIAAALGKDTVRKLLGKHGEKVEHHLDGAGFQAVFALRVLPGFPYWPVNYGAGVFGITQRDYLVASALATVPGQISLVSIGAFIGNPTFWQGVVVAVAWIIVAAVTVYAYLTWRRVSRRADEGPAAQA